MIRSKAVCVGQTAKERLIAQFKKDAKFLQEHSRMDYSLLLGIADCTCIEQPGDYWPTSDNNGLVAREEETGAKGAEVFFMGIIDILQEYNMRKGLEGQLKTAKHIAVPIFKRSKFATADNAVSSVSASHYSRRFVEFLEQRLK